jgi:hypothetical protein
MTMDAWNILERTFYTSRGVLPRRAVLKDGRIEENTAVGESDLDAVSLACDIIRSQNGQPTYSRLTNVLLSTCLSSNDPVAWKWLRNDLDLGVFNLMDELDAGDLIMNCMITAKDLTHACDIAAVAPSIKLSHHGHERMQLKFDVSWKDLCDAIDEWTRYELADRVQDIMPTLQKFMEFVCPVSVDECVRHLLLRKKLLLLPMFERCGVTASIATDIISALKPLVRDPPTVLLTFLCKAITADRDFFRRVLPGALPVLTDAIGELVKRPSIDKKTAVIIICTCKLLFSQNSLSSHVATLAMALCNAGADRSG